MGTIAVIPPALLKTKLFEGLDKAELLALVNKGGINSYNPGDAVLTEGETGEQFFCVITGALEITIRGKAEPVTLTVLTDGDILGEMVLVKKNQRTATATAARKSELLVWNYRDCLDLFSINPALGYKIMRNLAYMVTSKLTDMNIMFRDK